MTVTDKSTRTWEVLAIDPLVAGRLRERDDAGAVPRCAIDLAGGSPLRCCLRLSAPGEAIALVSYAPLRRWARQTGADPGPYDEVGPVFIHPQDCGGQSRESQAGGAYPEAFLGMRRVLRAYSVDGRILGGRLVEPDDVGDQAAASRLLAQIFADPQVALVHARAVDFGCFTFEARRAACRK